MVMFHTSNSSLAASPPVDGLMTAGVQSTWPVHCLASRLPVVYLLQKWAQIGCTFGCSAHPCALRLASLPLLSCSRPVAVAVIITIRILGCCFIYILPTLFFARCCIRSRFAECHQAGCSCESKDAGRYTVFMCRRRRHRQMTIPCQRVVLRVK